MVNDIATGPDGALWATDAITEFPLPAGTLPGVIVAAPDGALWFAEGGLGQVGRLDVDRLKRPR